MSESDSKGASSGDDRPLDRRRFFRQSLRKLLGPVVEAVEEKVNEVSRGLEQSLGAAGLAGKKNSGVSVSLRILRPPGALTEDDFLSACSRCGKCVEVCPAECIRMDESVAGGAPFIIASERACVVCSDLSCMMSCPSGALVPTRMFDIEMGLAEWSAESCLRSRGDSCRICVDDCPIGTKAIRLSSEAVGSGVIVDEAACVGCGLCENHCPTGPKSIVVRPRGLR